MAEVTRLLGRSEDEGSTVTVTTPDGQERLARYSQEGGQSVASYSAYTVPGIYRLATPGEMDFLAVNGTRAESHFEKIQLPDLQTRWRPLSITMEEEETFGQATAHTALPTRELGNVALLALLVVLAVESLYANRI